MFEERGRERGGRAEGRGESGEGGYTHQEEGPHQQGGEREPAERSS